MKGLMFAITALCLVVLVALGFAQDRKFEFVAGGGIDTPLNPSEFNDLYKLGFTGKIAAGYFVLPQFSLGMNASFNRFALDKDGVFQQLGLPTDPNIDISGGNLSIFEFAGVGKYYVMPRANRTNLYVLGGPGFAILRISDITVKSPDGEVASEKSDSETDFMLTGGIGIRQRLNSNLGLFLEGRYSYIFTEDDNTSYLPVRIGITF